MCLLCEVFKHLATSDICQVDLGFNFEHRHRSVSNSPSRNALVSGLVASATEVASTLAAHVIAGGTAADNARLLNTVSARYRHIALQWVPRYQHDALLNGLRYDVADEQHAVQVFTSALADAFQIPEDATAPDCVEQPSAREVLASADGVGKAILAAAIR
jgi:glucosyl-3-phosphoglycerate synthase